MENTAHELLEVLKNALPELQLLTEEQASFKPSQGKWSKKEIIGHLINSACNNQQKIVRGIISDCVMPPYAQDEWVAAQQYQVRNWLELVKFWCHCNLHIAHVIANIPSSSLQHVITINTSNYTLEYVASDYVVHLQHHLDQILFEPLS